MEESKSPQLHYRLEDPKQLRQVSFPSSNENYH